MSRSFLQIFIFPCNSADSQALDEHFLLIFKINQCFHKNSFIISMSCFNSFSISQNKGVDERYRIYTNRLIRRTRTWARKTHQAAIIRYGVLIKESIMAIPRKINERNRKTKIMARQTILLMKSCFWIFKSINRSLR